MDRGRLLGAGPPTALKARYGGGGCTVVAKATHADDAPALVQFLRTHLPAGHLLECRLVRLRTELAVVLELLVGEG